METAKNKLPELMSIIVSMGPGILKEIKKRGNGFFDLPHRLERLKARLEDVCLLYSSGIRRKTISQNRLTKYNLFNDIATYCLNIHDGLIKRAIGEGALILQLHLGRTSKDYDPMLE